MRPTRRSAPAAWAVATLVLLAAACTPLYLPPVPAELPEIPATLRLSEVRVVRLPYGPTGRPFLLARVDEVAEHGWLRVQWFPDVGAARASDARWLDQEAVGRTVRVPFPAELSHQQGRWRAVLSFQDRVLRQVEVPAGPSATGE